METSSNTRISAHSLLPFPSLGSNGGSEWETGRLQNSAPMWCLKLISRVHTISNIAATYLTTTQKFYPLSTILDHPCLCRPPLMWVVGRGYLASVPEFTLVTVTFWLGMQPLCSAVCPPCPLTKGITWSLKGTEGVERAFPFHQVLPPHICQLVLRVLIAQLVL